MALHGDILACTHNLRHTIVEEVGILSEYGPELPLHLGEATIEAHASAEGAW